MRKSIIIGILITMTLISCTKSSSLNPNTDNTTGWIGTYTDPTYGAVNKIVVTKTSNTSIQMLLLVNNYSTGYDTFTMLKNVQLKSTTTASITSNSIVSDTATCSFSGYTSINADTLTASATGINVDNKYDQHVFFFVGHK